MEGMRWAELAARMRVKARARRILVENIEGKGKHLDHYGVDGEIILK
jgi:hypothetical protein